MSRKILKFHSKFEHGYLQKGTKDSVAYDITTPVDIMMPCGTRRVIDTGIVVDVVSGIETPVFTMISPRSSTAIKHGIKIQNTVGIIDPDYCGQDDTLKVALERKENVIDYIGYVEIDGEKLKHTARNMNGAKLMHRCLSKLKTSNYYCYNNNLTINMCPRYVLSARDIALDLFYEDIENANTSVDGYFIQATEEELKSGEGSITVEFYNNQREAPSEPQFKKGERFAQLLVLPYESPELVHCQLENFSKDNRGGIGSTGK